MREALANEGRSSNFNTIAPIHRFSNWAALNAPHPGPLPGGEGV